ncbi:MAG: hypothetical protein JRE43_03380, partial [Deltaproteobacteria bacterium]|nr:hypothetical protein [Deltaproteobacteria bacterium]
EASLARSKTGALEVEKIVGATDYTAFLGNVGMSCIDMSFSGPYGVYHSQYDNYYWMSQIADVGFRYNTTMARLWAVLSWRIANADVLPMRYSGYAEEVGRYLEQMQERAARAGGKQIEFALAREASIRWRQSAEAFEAELQRRLSSDPPLSREVAGRIDTTLMGVERAMTEDSGLVRRPFFKHLIYAPQPSYREEVLPRIFEAIDDGRWEEIPGYEKELAAGFDRAAGLLDEARALLGEMTDVSRTESRSGARHGAH